MREISKKVFSQDLEVHEDLKLVIFNLPLQEEQPKWEIEDDILKVKSPRLDFQDKEVIEIPHEWRVREPKISFLNGILSFSWKEGD